MRRSCRVRGTKRLGLESQGMSRTDQIFACVIVVIFTLLVGVGAGFYLGKWDECQQGNTTFVCASDD